MRKMKNKRLDPIKISFTITKHSTQSNHNILILFNILFKAEEELKLRYDKTLADLNSSSKDKNQVSLECRYLLTC